jgi:translation initiation factor IF-3
MGGYYVSTFFMFKLIDMHKVFNQMEVFTIKDLLVNNDINIPTCRLVSEEKDEQGKDKQLGIMSINEARKLAEESGLDLVLISPVANPPVCRLMDYGKFRFDQTKKQREAKKKQKVAEMKVIQLSLNISEHDIEYRLNQAKDFLTSGAKVKLSILLKGRQAVYSARGIEVCNKFSERLVDFCNIEKQAVLEGKYITMVLAPKSAKDKK